MIDVESVRRVAVIGTGTIGASWAAYFLARGLHVTAWDPAPGAEARLAAFVGAAWPTLERLGIAGGASPANLRFAASPEAAVEGAEFVQESGPERLPVKVELLTRLDEVLGEQTVLATSSSGLLLSDLQEGRRAGSRYVLGHPFNPPHLIPLVEVLGGKRTEPAAVDWAIAFYRAIGKRPIRLNREVPGHLVNRIQAALWREAADAVASGLASMEDVDAAIAYGPGLRWGVMGPHAIFTLAGGPGGMRDFLEHFGPPIESWWADMNPVSLTPEVKRALVEQSERMLAGRTVESLAAERDALLVALLETLAAVRADREEG